MSVDLSILVCSVAERYNNFAQRIQHQLYTQLDGLASFHMQRVEILMLTDTCSMSIGEKRNHLVAMASGKYTVFIDDDDRVADDYIQSLLDATQFDTDVITFSLEYRLDGVTKRTVKHSLAYDDSSYRNKPRHTSAVRRSIALRIPFADTSYGEDYDWSQQLTKVAVTEHIIPKTLYIYEDCPRTSTARRTASKTHPQAYQRWVDAQCQ